MILVREKKVNISSHLVDLANMRMHFGSEKTRAMIAIICVTLGVVLNVESTTFFVALNYVPVSTTATTSSFSRSTVTCGGVNVTCVITYEVNAGYGVNYSGANVNNEEFETGSYSKLIGESLQALGDILIFLGIIFGVFSYPLAYFKQLAVPHHT